MKLLKPYDLCLLTLDELIVVPLPYPYIKRSLGVNTIDK